MSEYPYIHGFSPVEMDRLRKQARFAEHVIYRDIDLTSVKKLLEIGCGVGAQTEILLRRYPDLSIVGIDRSDEQLKEARRYLSSQPGNANRFELFPMDAAHLEFESQSFDGAFICWLLEHVSKPINVLKEVKRTLKPYSVVYITEVMNSSFLLDPYSPNTWKYWQAFNDYQIDTGGDPFIGVKLGNLLSQASFDHIVLTEKVWHFDNRFPDKRAEIIAFWSELLLSASDQLIREKRVDSKTVEGMKLELKRVAKEPNAVFYYSFIQAQATA